MLRSFAPADLTGTGSVGSRIHDSNSGSSIAISNSHLNKAGKYIMEMKEVKDLIREVLKSDISEFELEHTNTRIKLKRVLGRDAGIAPHVSVQTLSSGTPAPLTASIGPGTTPGKNAEDTEEGSFHIITSPIVGTVYASPSPGAEPYVHLGDHVHEGSVLCIVEAMKLLNEISSDVEGEIVRIYIENGNPVEFGQKLFAIRPQK
jgi:acetyl-CoA carboxylase biotin carboxyl carrier protein